MRCEHWLFVLLIAVVVGCDGKHDGGDADSGTAGTEGTMADAGDGASGSGGGGASGDGASGSGDAGDGSSDAGGGGCIWAAGNPNDCPVCADDTTCDAPTYTDNGDGTVTSSCCGLTWEQALGAGDFSDYEMAMEYCAALDLPGTGWRIPTIEELNSLVVFGQDPVWPAAFPDTKTLPYWSMTPFEDTDDYVWMINFGDGSTYEDRIYAGNPLRCVR